MRRLLALTLAVSLPIGLAACGDDGTGPDDDDVADGTFEASVSGDLTGNFSGQAVFGEASDPATGDSYWVLILTNGSENTGRTIYFGREGSRPSGTVSLADVNDEEPAAGEVFGLYFDYSSQTTYGVFASTGGTLNITRSDGDDMEGTFTIQATGTSIQGSEAVEVNITISGSFSARSGNVGLPTTF